MRRTPLVVAVALLATACSGGDDDASSTTTAQPTTEPADATAGSEANDAAASSTTAPSSTAPSSTAQPGEPYEPIDLTPFVAPGVEQLTIVDLDPGTVVRAVGGDADSSDTDLERAIGGTVDAEGVLVIRGLDSDVDWRLVVDATSISDTSFDVLGRDEHPEPAFYAEQRLPTDELGYITTRDGTTLSANVWLPGPADGGPYPTVVEYSGYQPSDPESNAFPTLFNTLGYAYVGVNVRGTGCSGGSYAFFEYAQNLDGYDVVETIAAQPWVLGQRVGMVGVSYPGITQLFVAQTQPPSLAAITPLSVIADTARSTLYPGGLLNTGFAVEWAGGVIGEAQPFGQAWTADRVAAGDTMCDRNQRLRLQNQDVLQVIDENAFWTDEVAAELAPRLFADRITVPTYIAGAWQDEQTGGHFATMLDRFTGTDQLDATLMNGLHTDSIGPVGIPRLIEFLDLYVARRTPSLATARVAAPLLGTGLYGTSEIALPPTDRFAGLTYDEALAAFESEPPIRVAFEQGAADGFPDRAPMARFEAAFDAWPIPETEATRWHLSGDGISGGVLDEEPPSTDDDRTTYLALPEAIPPTFYDGSSSGIWSVDVEYDWQEAGPGTFATWATEPLADETVIIGSGSVDLYVQSNLGDTDLEVTITEIRPDGQEMYVQSGWLRASHRALDVDASTELRPVHTHREEDAAPLPDGEFELVRVELLPFAHVFREGSRLRLIVDAPGGNRAVWAFDTISEGEQVSVAHDAAFPSSLVLPVVPGVDAPDAFPVCGSLRGQPCRTYTGN